MPAASAAQTDLFRAAPLDADGPTEAYNFRLLGNRGLAQTWRQRAADNVAAVRLLQKIELEARPATEDEQRRLARFVGFGATEVANAIFRDKDDSPFRQIAKSLKSAITAEEWASLSQATQYAHYTPEYLVRSIWKALRQFGFTGGAILDPGCGTGMFAALMPEGIASRSTYLGVERDPITARIATLLYPEFDVLQADFTKTALPEGFDLAIGNPPFSAMSVSATDEVGKLGVTLHNYFVARSIERLRPGGLAAFVVSRYLMDASTRKTREYIAKLQETVRHLQNDIKARVPVNPDAFSMVVDGQAYTDNEPGAVFTVQTAEEAKAHPLLPARERAAKAIEQAIRNAEFEAKERDWIIGEYCGFQLGAEGWWHNWTTNNGKQETAYILRVKVLRHGQRDAVYEQDIKRGDTLLTRIERVVEGFEIQLASAESQIRDRQAIVKDYEPRISSAGFDLQPVLDEKVALLRELNASLEAPDPVLADEEGAEAEAA